jgi:hypothetical protein
MVPKVSIRLTVALGGELQEDDVAELALGVVGDAHLVDPVLVGGLQVLVLLGVEEVVGDVGHGSSGKPGRGGREGFACARNRVFRRVRSRRAKPVPRRAHGWISAGPGEERFHVCSGMRMGSSCLPSG